MRLYVLRRILVTIPMMAVVALFVFGLLYLAPGDPAAMIAGDQATPAQIESIRSSLGIDQPRAGSGCLDSGPRKLSGFLPGFTARGPLRFCRGVERA